MAVATSEDCELRHALHVGRLVGIAGIGRHPVAQDEVGRLRMRRRARGEREEDGTADRFA